MALTTSPAASPSSRGARIASIALAHAPCSSRGPDDAAVARYADLLIRPNDPLTTAARAYYLANPSLSTCALTVLGCWRLAGCLEPECVDGYYPGPQGPGRVGKAFSDVQALAQRFGAWEAGLQGPLLAGDAWVIVDGSGGDGHMGLCVADQGADDDGRTRLTTVEGGQFDGKGSTAILGPLKRRLFAFAGGRWSMGERSVFGVVRADRLPVPDAAGA